MYSKHSVVFIFIELNTPYSLYSASSTGDNYLPVNFFK